MMESSWAFGDFPLPHEDHLLQSSLTDCELFPNLPISSGPCAPLPIPGIDLDVFSPSIGVLTSPSSTTTADASPLYNLFDGTDTDSVISDSSNTRSPASPPPMSNLSNPFLPPVITSTSASSWTPICAQSTPHVSTTISTPLYSSRTFSTPIKQEPRPMVETRRTAAFKVEPAAPPAASAPKKRTRKTTATTTATTASSSASTAAAAAARNNSHALDSDSSDDQSVASGLCKRERNKMSAAKYRKRRKMYVDQLEDKVSGLEKKCATQADSLTKLSTENKVLKEQLAFFKNLVSNRGGAPASNKLMFVMFSCFVFSIGAGWNSYHKSQPLTIQGATPMPLSASDDFAVSQNTNIRKLLSVDEHCPNSNSSADHDCLVSMEGVSTGACKKGSSCTIEEVVDVPRPPPADGVCVAATKKPIVLAPRPVPMDKALMTKISGPAMPSRPLSPEEKFAMSVLQSDLAESPQLALNDTNMTIPALEKDPLDQIFRAPSEAFERASLLFQSS